VKILPLFLALLASGQVNAFAQQAPPSGSQMNGDLQELIGTLQKIVDESIASKQGEKLSIHLESMRVPGYETWFPATFGPENGAKLAALYSEGFPKQESRLLEYFVAHGERGGRVEARLASGGSDQQKTELQRRFDKAIRQSVTKPTLFYELQYTGKAETTGYPFAVSFGYVTLIDRAYRLLGDNVLAGLSGMPAARIRIGGKTTAGMVLYKVQPEYPDEARKKRVSGTVRLHAIIGTDGTISSLDVVSGDSLLVQAALDAVRQWRYRPTTLNGEAVEVDTVIDIIFSLTN
jgi:TonB family protein